MVRILATIGGGTVAVLAFLLAATLLTPPDTARPVRPVVPDRVEQAAASPPARELPPVRTVSIGSGQPIANAGRSTARPPAPQPPASSDEVTGSIATRPADAPAVPDPAVPVVAPPARAGASAAENVAPAAPAPLPVAPAASVPVPDGNAAPAARSGEDYARDMQAIFDAAGKSSGQGRADTGGDGLRGTEPVESDAAVPAPEPVRYPKGKAGCTKYRTYDPVTQTYRGYDGFIHDCRPTRG